MISNNGTTTLGLYDAIREGDNVLSEQVFDNGVSQEQLNTRLFSGLARSNNTTTFNSNGTISQTIDGVTVSTTFNSNGSISTVYGSPISKTITTTFSGNNINEVIT